MKHLLRELAVPCLLIGIQDGVRISAARQHTPPLLARQLLDNFRCLLGVHRAGHVEGQLSSERREPLHVLRERPGDIATPLATAKQGTP